MFWRPWRRAFQETPPFRTRALGRSVSLRDGALKLALAWALAVVAGAVAEAGPGGGARAFRVKHWSSDDGLPQNRIACLKQTRDGYLWIGTWNGLVRFDGVRFTVFNHLNTPELKNAPINALAEEEDGTLWVGTRDGLVSYRALRFHRLAAAEGLPEPEVWQLAQARGGGVWFQAGSFVGRFEGGRLSRPLRMESPGRVLSLNDDADGWLNIFKDNGWQALSLPAGRTRTNYAVQAGTSGWLAAWPANQTGHIWVGTDRKSVV